METEEEGLGTEDILGVGLPLCAGETVQHGLVRE